MFRRSASILLSIIIVCTLVACQTSTPATPTATPTVPPSPTATTTPTATATPTATPIPTNTPKPTATFTATPTPEPSIILHIIDEVSGDPVSTASVYLFDTETYSQTAAADKAGQVTFSGLNMATYTVTVSADGYLAYTSAVEAQSLGETLTVNLKPGIFAAISAATANLRGGPGEVYPIVGKVNEAAIVEVIGQSKDGAWLVVRTAEGSEGWIAAALVASQSSLDRVSVAAAPPTPTPRPATPTPAATATTAPVAPRPAAPPTGANLLLNPGFEEGVQYWYSEGANDPLPAAVITAQQLPMSVYSGQRSALTSGGGNFAYQKVNVTPGVTYRAGAWVRLWSSITEDRNVSTEPQPVWAHICINTIGGYQQFIPETFCSAPVKRFDTWQYIAVDAIATRDILAVVIAVNPNKWPPMRGEAAWDDVSLGISPKAATPVPAATATPAPPSRPAPVAFDGVALRDSMLNAHTQLTQIGGLLDRATSGQTVTCEEFNGYYRALVGSPTYHSIPADWQNAYNEYNWAVEHGKQTSESIYALCTGGGGKLTGLNYGVARMGINESLERLGPAINMANGLLGQ